MTDVSALLTPWNSFYVLVGTSASALTGLMFVVISLVSSDRRNRSTAGISVFSTPTVVHFSSALFVSALMSAPFRSLTPIVITLAAAGAGGVFYAVRIAISTTRLSAYRPDTEDWIWHVLLPFVAYALIAGGGVALLAAPAPALCAPAAGAALLIFIGIHNAWDVVTFLASGQAAAIPDEPDRELAVQRDE